MRILNTHFDHEGILARSASAALIIDAITQFQREMPTCPQVLCGDFNSPKSSEAYTLLARELKDVFRTVSAENLLTAGVRSTIHKWQGMSFSDEMGDGTVDLSGQHSNSADTRHIDWILWKSGCSDFGSTKLEPVKCRVVTDTLPNGRYPSDHFPLSATFLASRASNVQSRL